MDTSIYKVPFLLLCISIFTDGRDIQAILQNDTGTLSCNGLQFKCKNGEKCIDEWNECDMLEDCADHSDEHDGCETFTCDSGEEVYPEKYRCDGVADCLDKSDELGERANCTEFTCKDGKIISEKQLCDRIDDCTDKYRSDECNCSFTFTCANGKCISEELVCDQIDDCGDGSDEDDCPTMTFDCLDGQVIDASLKCDGKADCVDTSDECVCTETFTCNNHRCISQFMLNDGTDDCGDGSDETMTTIAGRVEATSFTPTPVDNVTVIDTTSQTLSKFVCVDGRTIDHQLLCDGTDNCEDGYRSDECDCENTIKCARENGQTRCIPDEFQCNGVNDCDDSMRSDECDCPGTFTCIMSRQCLPDKVLCDGKKDCADGSDEIAGVAGCPRTECEGGFRCGNGNCVHVTQNCDGVDNCGDCSDETECMRPDNLYHCREGGCIEKSQRCDGFEDCRNADDEENCYVKTEMKTTSTTSPKITTTVGATEYMAPDAGSGGSKTTSPNLILLIFLARIL